MVAGSGDLRASRGDGFLPTTHKDFGPTRLGRLFCKRTASPATGAGANSVARKDPQRGNGAPTFVKQMPEHADACRCDGDSHTRKRAQRYDSSESLIAQRPTAASALLLCYDYHPQYAVATFPEESPTQSARTIQYRHLDSVGRLDSFHPHVGCLLLHSQPHARNPHFAGPADFRL